MAQITINIPDTYLQQTLDAFADQYGWYDAMGVTKAQFAKTKIVEYIKLTRRNYLAKVEADIDIT